MEAKYQERKEELLDECQMEPQIFEDLLPRLEEFMIPYVENLVRKEQVAHANTLVQGLLSDLEKKNVESIAIVSVRDACRCNGFWVTLLPGITSRCVMSWCVRLANSWEIKTV